MIEESMHGIRSKRGWNRRGDGWLKGRAGEAVRVEAHQGVENKAEALQGKVRKPKARKEGPRQPRSRRL